MTICNTWTSSKKRTKIKIQISTKIKILHLNSKHKITKVIKNLKIWLKV